MRTAKLLIWLCLLIVTAITVSAAAATLTGLKVTSNTVNSGTVTLSVNVSAAGKDLTNCTWTTTSQTLGTNNSINRTYYTKVLNTALITDEYQTTLTVTCRNRTKASTSYTATSTLVTFDNTAPTISCQVSPPSFFEVKSRLRVDCSRTTDSPSSTATMTWRHKLTAPGGSIVEKTDSDVTFRGNDIMRKGKYALISNVTDPANFTTLTSSLTLTGKESNEITPEEQAEVRKTETKRSMFWLLGGVVGLAAIVVIIIIIAVSVRGKKKRR